eukprot:3614388-Pyramimonas_sp.AAC.1
MTGLLVLRVDLPRRPRPPTPPSGTSADSEPTAGPPPRAAPGTQCHIVRLSQSPSALETASHSKTKPLVGTLAGSVPAAAHAAGRNPATQIL